MQTIFYEVTSAELVHHVSGDHRWVTLHIKSAGETHVVVLHLDAGVQLYSDVPAELLTGAK